MIVNHHFHHRCDNDDDNNHCIINPKWKQQPLPRLQQLPLSSSLSPLPLPSPPSHHSQHHNHLNTTNKSNKKSLAPHNRHHHNDLVITTMPTLESDHQSMRIKTNKSDPNHQHQNTTRRGWKSQGNRVCRVECYQVSSRWRPLGEEPSSSGRVMGWREMSLRIEWGTRA